jgi:uncharacterized protein
MSNMARLLQQRQAPSNVMELMAAQDAKRNPYAPCPCGSGNKFRFCHGDNAPRSNFSKVDSTPPAQHSKRVIPVRAVSPVMESNALSSQLKGTQHGN